MLGLRFTKNLHNEPQNETAMFGLIYCGKNTAIVDSKDKGGRLRDVLGWK